jgi:hypothetical protein
LGCGFEWAHCKTGIDEKSPVYPERHMCPMCGTGPWFMIAPSSKLDPPRELPQTGDLLGDDIGFALVEIAIIERQPEPEPRKPKPNDEMTFVQMLGELFRR